MISTCVHCKKQFEWEGKAAFTAIVQCCHCTRIAEYNSEGIPTVYQSKPLQVAKKWVVRKDSTYWLRDDGTFYNVFNAQTKRFDNLADAVHAYYMWAEKYAKDGSLNQTASFEQVESK